MNEPLKLKLLDALQDIYKNDTSTDKKTKLENMTDILNLAKIIESYDELEPKLREMLNEKGRKDKWGER